MKKFLTFLFGDLGLGISAVVCTGLLSIFLPLFLNGIQGSFIVKLLSWIIAFPFILGFGLSALGSSGTLIFRGCGKGLKTMKAVYIIFGLVIFICLALILILNLV